MKLRITVDAFSGRENPTFVLTERQSKVALDRLRPAEKLTRAEAKAPPPRLGYRGLIVEQLGARSKSLPQTLRVAAGRVLGDGVAHFAADRDFESFVLREKGPIRKAKLSQKEIRTLKVDVVKFHEWMLKWPDWVFRPGRCKPCACAPLYEPVWWNDGGQKQFNNNCYNYACNYRTDTFAQPGRAAGAMYGALTCASVRPAAIADELIDKPGANNRCPTEGHLVALVVAPGWDFHWYRKGRNGCWSHKPGGTSVTNLDNSGKTIVDPRTADRGAYTDFCTFMVVMHGHIKIN